MYITLFASHCSKGRHDDVGPDFNPENEFTSFCTISATCVHLVTVSDSKTFRPVKKEAYLLETKSNNCGCCCAFKSIP